ncbi:MULTISPECIES: trigger factor [Staphylococcus]|uniref:Trigger factor n=2 Tax=Staphylococcus TaxID=1279 RepID=A0A8X8GNS0_STAHO|nr:MULTISPECIES: trigger factor [Staphylococcus]EUZ70575.1 trigger factor [Staphylococcus sp. M0480]OFM61971.1 trigger factor [Staphylococcus sp. HMSC062C01]OFM77434.1 trigger factor [Staphylococcus sp. HMSC074B09]OFM93430.1 trigger factor [Staphylococcus sp. HMSC078D05]OFS48695.1 trigger factor [Staphylococcus sp. HMSC075H09]OHO58984.1 trigger factor [Staphylococcus sp. HMSC035F02]SIG73794.1 trigger factor (TF) protein TIG [Mycobacteroides abscessus subsp. abscessus]
MTATWEKKEGNEGLLKVTVPAEKVNKALDQAFKKVVKQINVPGFRKGKVPRPIFEQRFGVEALYQDAVDILLPEAYGEAIEETKINPVAQPEINVTQIEKGKDFEFEATVTVEPEVKLGDYKGLEIEKQDSELTDQDLQDEIDHSLGHLADMVVKEDGAVEEGDTVNIDFDGYVDGEQFEGGQADGYDLEIGSGSFIPGFEDQLVGVKTGEEKDVVVTFPEEYHAEELAGKEATFKTKVNEIKYKEVPELTDEIANELDSDANSVDEYKENLRKRLSEQKAQDAENVEKEEAINKVTENTTIDIPQAMIDTELDRMVQEFGQRIQQQGLDLQTYFQISGQDESQLREQMKDDAEQRVKTNLTLSAIADEENIEVTDEDIDKELEKMSSQFNISVEDIKQTLGNTDIIKNDVRIQKVIDLLRDNAKYVDSAKEDKKEDK